MGNEAEALAEQKKLTSKSYRVTSYVEKEKRRSPGPPFTTSTMQQAAANTLGFTGKKTMAVAQSLYEGVDLGDGDRVGLITYMRTDAVRVASSAVAAARKVIAAAHGEQYLPSAPRGYKSRRGAQEAHEAIRPTDPGRTPEALKRFLTPDQNKLYNLIYRRFLASQMADALLDTVAADLEGNGYAFHASAQRVKFPGFLKVLPAQEKETFVPKLAVGDEATLVDSAAAQHFTEPPARYNDASLVRALEGYGIGRPSTYAPIVSTIIDRNYVERRGRAFFPTELGKLVNALLVASFPDVVNVKFTAEIESELDLVEEGREDWRVVLRNFYHPFAADLEKAGAVMDAVRDDAVERTDVACPKCGALMDIRWGRYGKYLRCTNYPDCQGTLNFKRGEDGQIIAVHPEDTGETCEICGAPMIVKRGRFGEFLACSKYPECKNTRRLRKKIDALCPKCGGQVVQIPGKGRGRRPFYGCTNYPKCDFTSSAEPVNEPCPQCGAHYLVKSRKGKKCAQKGCGYEG